MKVNDNNILDKRLVKRHITNGLVEAKAYNKHLEGLDDLADIMLALALLAMVLAIMLTKFRVRRD